MLEYRNICSYTKPYSFACQARLLGKVTFSVLYPVTNDIPIAVITKNGFLEVTVEMMEEMTFPGYVRV